MQKRSKTAEKFSVDRMMTRVASSLVSDFQDNLNDPSFCSDFQREVATENIAGIRRLCPAPDSETDVARYKAAYQLGSVVKRYRFSNDIYSDQELVETAVKGFKDTQDRLAKVNLDSLPASAQWVLELAARYVAQTLGPYCDEEHRDLCRFGRKASVGIPARLACEAARWELPITGSCEQIKWFDSEMSEIESVQDYWRAQKGSDPTRSTYHAIDHLTLSLVPKSFKSLRAIMPNSTIGSYMSFGLGEIMRKRLKRVGYDIKTLQKRHRHLASQASVHGLYTTADLSSASDSITVALVERLFPSDWFAILQQSRIGNVLLPDGSIVQSDTFCTMGIGYTFPLQTLVFLALLHAIQAVLYKANDRRLISVYGDDMIYATRMHDEVVFMMQQFGFVFNVDKTFSTGHFRESCGGDYFHGVDVRPFQPRNGSAVVGKRSYEAILYKYVNGLLARWSEYEIGRTLNYLVSEIEQISGCCKIVPSVHSDDAGIKCPSLTHWQFLLRARVASPVHLGHGVYRFSYLRLVADEREEVRHEPYYWLGLRGGSPAVDYSSAGQLREARSPLLDIVNRVVGVNENETPLITRDLQPIKTFRSELSGCRLRRQSTFVTISHTGRYTRQSGTSRFEDRR